MQGLYCEEVWGLENQLRLVIQIKRQIQRRIQDKCKYKYKEDWGPKNQEEVVETGQTAKPGRGEEKARAPENCDNQFSFSFWTNFTLCDFKRGPTLSAAPP